VEESKEQQLQDESRDQPPAESQETTASEPTEGTVPEGTQEPPAVGELAAGGEPAGLGGLETPQGEELPDGAVPVPAAVASRGRSPVPVAVAAAVVGFAAVGIFVLGMFTHAMVESDDGGSGQPAAAALVQPTAGPQPTQAPVDVSVDDDPARGPEDAPVTVIEFSDFQCPFCARFHAQTLGQLTQDYGDRIRFVYRDFPLTNIHPYALKAAEAAECADEQGAFWNYHDLLFQNQQTLTDLLDPDPVAGLPKVVDSLKGYATQLELDAAAFNQCLDSNKYVSEIQKDVDDGIAAGVQGTPSFFINGSIVRGAQPYAAFQGAIEAALEDAGG